MAREVRVQAAADRRLVRHLEGCEARGGPVRGARVLVAGAVQAHLPPREGERRAR